MEQAKGKRIDVRGINIIVHINGGVTHAHQVNISYHPGVDFLHFAQKDIVRFKSCFIRNNLIKKA
ncbi:hypothetical protein [Bacillus toyonensis]|uniref:Uncharacterized protein n=1 Tax=Bacillus toyonensis TaxID=155322 RepID=A0A2A8H730_9BACI|nr:hypothetical protein [Bacillus toyonensis]PEP88624.1 hypothetical protein CN585_29305 [Bacillus toyonensis]